VTAWRGRSAWRLVRSIHALDWASGEGAAKYGGRWNSRGVRAVYASLEPSLAVLEVAVHTGFPALDATPHTLFHVQLVDPSSVAMVAPADVPNPNWLRTGAPSAGQQAFGDDLLSRCGGFIVPSVIVPEAWNLVFSPEWARDGLDEVRQSPFALDTRLNPPGAGP
jgi:RES domain-containing protein